MLGELAAGRAHVGLDQQWVPGAVLPVRFYPSDRNITCDRGKELQSAPVTVNSRLLCPVPLSLQEKQRRIFLLLTLVTKCWLIRGGQEEKQP